MARSAPLYRPLQGGGAVQFVGQEIEWRAPAELIPSAKHARQHTEAHVRQVVAAIQQWGWTIPVLIDERAEIIAGHGRTLAAQRLGLEKIPVIVARGWSEAQKLAYSIADNKLTEEGEWNEELLKVDLRELQAEGFDISSTGFSDEDVARWMAEIRVEEADASDPDDAPLLPEVAVSRRGDVWLMDQHRIICGDSTDRVTVQRLLAGQKPHLMVTDPPYGVEYDADWRNRAARSSLGMGNRAIGAGAVGKVENDDRADWREAWALFPGDVAYVWHAGVRAASVAESLQAADFAIRSQIIWAKSNFAIGRGDYHWQHEPCWYAVREGATSRWAGDRKQTTLWEIGKPPKSETGHSTQKPVECMLRPIVNNSQPGDAVYEPFSGSGTTIIAASIARRIALAAEINPLYVDVAVRRWQTFTLGAAKLLGDGRTFDQIAAERLPQAAEAGGK